MQTDLTTNCDIFKTKKYFKKPVLTEEEICHNNDLYEDIINNEFPSEDMIDKSFRDKVDDIFIESIETLFLFQFQDKEMALKSWVLSVSFEVILDFIVEILLSVLRLLSLG